MFIINLHRFSEMNLKLSTYGNWHHHSSKIITDWKMKRILEMSDPRFIKFDQFNNILINFYLDGFKRREKDREKPMIVLVNYLTIFSNIVCIVKLLAAKFKKLSFTTKLILFDTPSLFGGIELYNRIFLVFTLILGLAVHITFRWTKSETHREWTQVFELTRSREPHKLVKDKSQMDDLIKLVKAMKVVYKIWTPLFFIMGIIIIIIKILI